MGGAEKTTAHLAKVLAAAGHQVTAISLHDGAEEKIEDWHGVRAIYLPLDNIYWPFTAKQKPPAFKRLLWHIINMWNFKAARRIGALLDTIKPDIVNTHMITGFSAAIWWEIKKRKIPLAHTLHEYGLLCPRMTLFKKGAMCAKRCVSCVALTIPNYVASRWVDQLVGVSAYTKDRHQHFGYFPHAAHRVIHNMVETPLMQPHAVPNRPFSFGFIGRIEEEKGIEVVLKAAARLPHKNWRLVIAGRGRGDYVQHLKKTYALANILWLGFVPPDDYFNQIDLLIVPSIWPEPFASVVPQAAAREIPVLLSDVGGMPEFLRIGVRWQSVPAGDVDALSAAMHEAYEGRGVMALPPAPNPAWQDLLSETTVKDAYLACYYETVFDITHEFR